MRKEIIVRGVRTGYTFDKDMNIYTAIGKLVKQKSENKVILNYNGGSISLIKAYLNQETGQYDNFYFKEDFNPTTEYKDIGKHLVCKDGRVYSKQYKKWLKPQKTKTGYMLIGVGQKGAKMVYVHRLVWETFVGLLECGDRSTNGYKWEINHKDFDKTNNHLDNLELVTRARNLNHAMEKRKELNIKRKHVVGVRRVSLCKEIIQYDYLGNEINRYPNIFEASEKTGVPKSTIICRIYYGSQWDIKEFAIRTMYGYTLYLKDKTTILIGDSDFKSNYKGKIMLVKKFPETYYQWRFKYENYIKNESI